MPIIYRYLVRETLKYFAIITLMVIGIYVAVDFFEKVDDFMEAGLPFTRVFRFFLFKIPFIVAQITPVGFLLAILVVFGLMNKNNEMTALRTSGVNVAFLLKPILSMGFLFSLFLLFMAEVVVPITVADANYIWQREVRKEKAVTAEGKNIWIKGERSIIHIKLYTVVDNTIRGVTLNFFDPDFRLSRRIDAYEGRFENGRWRLFDIMEQTLDRAEDRYQTVFVDERFETLGFVPDDLKRVTKKSEEMGFKELLAYIRKVEAEGYDATIYRVDLYAKFSFPLVCFVLSFVGAGISFRGRLKDGLPMSITYGIGIAFLYWIFYSFCVSLGYAEMLPPLIAVTTANFVFLCFGGMILINTD